MVLGRGGGSSGLVIRRRTKTAPVLGAAGVPNVSPCPLTWRDTLQGGLPGCSARVDDGDSGPAAQRWGSLPRAQLLGIAGRKSALSPRGCESPASVTCRLCKHNFRSHFPRELKGLYSTLTPGGGNWDQRLRESWTQQPRLDPRPPARCFRDSGAGSDSSQTLSARRRSSCVVWAPGATLKLGFRRLGEGTTVNGMEEW